jgi:hypothetical protein
MSVNGCFAPMSVTSLASRRPRKQTFVVLHADSRQKHGNVMSAATLENSVSGTEDDCHNNPPDPENPSGCFDEGRSDWWHFDINGGWTC